MKKFLVLLCSLFILNCNSLEETKTISYVITNGLNNASIDVITNSKDIYSFDSINNEFYFNYDIEAQLGDLVWHRIEINNIHSERYYIDLYIDGSFYESSFCDTNKCNYSSYIKW